MEKFEEDLFYRPNIGIEHDYYSEGEYRKERKKPDKETETPAEINNLLEEADKIIEDLIKIHKILPFLPEKLYKILKDIVEKLVFQTIIEENKLKKEKIIENKEKEEKKYIDQYEKATDKSIASKIEIDKTKPLDKDVESLLNNLGPSGFSIQVTRVKSNKRLAEDQYLRDSLAIKEDFTKKLNFSLSQYVYPLLNIMSESGVNKIEYLNYDYDATSVTGIEKDSQHLSDIIVRSQILVGENVKLMQRTHGIKETTAAILAFDAAAQERSRYYEEDYNIGMKKYSDIYKNKYLSECRKDYDAKYLKTKTNMYKYLNSAVINSTEILKDLLAANISKCHLLAQGVNIFEHKEYESQGYINSTSQNVEEFKSDNNSDTVSPSKKSETGKESDIKKEDTPDKNPERKE